MDRLRLFDPRRMLEAHFQACFESAAKDRLPQPARDELLEAEGTLCVAGRGSACDSAFKQADLLVSQPTEAIKGMDANAIEAALHLRDETPEADGYQRACNGVLRLFNLISSSPSRGGPSRLSSRGEPTQTSPVLSLQRRSQVPIGSRPLKKRTFVFRAFRGSSPHWGIHSRTRPASN